MGVTLFKNCKFLFGGADPESVSTGLSVAVEDDRILFLGTEKEYYEQHPEKSLFTVIVRISLSCRGWWMATIICATRS